MDLLTQVPGNVKKKSLGFAMGDQLSSFSEGVLMGVLSLSSSLRTSEFCITQSYQNLLQLPPLYRCSASPPISCTDALLVPPYAVEV